MYSGLSTHFAAKTRTLVLVLVTTLRISQPFVLAQGSPSPVKGLALASKGKPKLPPVIKNLRTVSHDRALLKLRGDRVGIAAAGQIKLPHVSGLKRLASSRVAVAANDHRDEWFVAHLDGRVAIEEALTHLAQEPSVLKVEPDYVMSLPKPVQPQGGGAVTADRSTNDQYLNEQYALDRIRAFDAWQTTSGNQNVVVAVVDSGTQLNHPDLSANIWQNPNEVVNGFDDDGNGYIDDTHGYDLANNDNAPFDDNGHGTHVAGIIAAAQGNGLGIAGVARVSIMPVKVIGADGFGDMSVIMSGVQYAIDQGAEIINLSLGGGGYSQAFDEICEYAAAHNVLVLAASGNESAGEIGYPAAYDSVIAVGATDANDRHASFSNRGHGLELVAPGVQILSTYINSDYSYLDGTSMACPYAAGVAALIRSAHPEWTVQQLRSVLAGTADDLGAFGYDVQYGHGRINAYRALTETPAPVVPPVATAPNTGTWGDDSFEPNNNSSSAVSLVNGSYQLEGWDEDWFTVSVTTAGYLDLYIAGAQGDLDLFIFNEYGQELSSSIEYGSVEMISIPVQSGFYYVSVAPYENQGSSYVLTVNAPVGFSPNIGSGVTEPDLTEPAFSVPPVPAMCGAGVAQAALFGFVGFIGLGGGRRRIGF